MTKLSYTELLDYLLEILKHDAFELHIESFSDNSQNFYIPYMMNDALECYLLLENGRITGTYLPDCKEMLSVEFIDEETQTGLIFHQGEDNVFTLWFSNCYQVLKLYRYDQIGHFWVKGQEHWRQLVYIIGTIYDKYSYMGNTVCNNQELHLLPLIEFAPFRYYSPLHESLDTYYAETSDGANCMMTLAKEANDTAFLFWVKVYQRFSLGLVSRILSWMLNRPARQPLYELIYNKIQRASMEYPERSYSKELNTRITSERLTVSEKLFSQGFMGKYPRFYKENVQILATEEHPFTILESDTFHFKIQLMVSETKRKNPGLNAGFFKKHNNSGFITDI